MHWTKPLALAAGLAFWAGAWAQPVTYELDPSHTYPSFEADHMGGLSTWRGKFNRTSGTLVLDRQARSGTLDITVDIASVDFGHDEMNKHAVAEDILNAAKYPSATFKGRFDEFEGDVPRTAVGEFTLKGVTRPLTLQIEQFKCLDKHPMLDVPVCGADVSAEFDRGDYGVDFALDKGFRPEVRLRIQVEALGKQG
ncbi:YceI family protein [Orrella sp. JC864]|uniref:YceI family protein n=1 Tax=Orrella sp. JC864 TaxID=3120298 RepID=UPI0012BC080D